MVIFITIINIIIIIVILSYHYHYHISYHISLTLGEGRCAVSQILTLIHTIHHFLSVQY